MDTTAKLLSNLEYSESIHNSFAGILCLAFRKYVDINVINSPWINIFHLGRTFNVAESILFIFEVVTLH